MLMPSWKERSLSEVLHASDQAIAAGRPVILVDLASDCPLAVADIFAPLTMIHPYSTLDEALAINSRCPYGLTASIFGDEQKALVLAKQLNVGSVVIKRLDRSYRRSPIAVWRSGRKWIRCYSRRGRVAGINATQGHIGPTRSLVATSRISPAPG